MTDNQGNTATGEVAISVGGEDASPPPHRLSVITVADSTRLRIEAHRERGS